VCVSSDLAVHHELAGLAEVFGEQRASHVAAKRVLHTQQRSEVTAVCVRGQTVEWSSLTCMLMNTPWYVSYRTLLPLACSGNSKGISVLPAGIFPGFTSSMLLDTSWTGCRTQTQHHPDRVPEHLSRASEDLQRHFTQKYPQHSLSLVCVSLSVCVCVCVCVCV